MICRKSFFKNSTEDLSENYKNWNNNSYESYFKGKKIYSFRKNTFF